MWSWFKHKKANKTKKISTSFKKRDSRISRVEEEVKGLKESLSKIIENSERLARIEGAVSVLLNKSQSQGSIKQSHSNIETKVIRNLRKNKKSLVMAEIEKLKDIHTTIEIYEIIVKERGLCSKASFYRYIASLKSQSLISIEKN